MVYMYFFFYRECDEKIEIELKNIYIHLKNIKLIFVFTYQYTKELITVNYIPF